MLTELHTFAHRPENIREVFLISFHDHHSNMKGDFTGNCNVFIGNAIVQTLCENATNCLAIHQYSAERRGQWLSLAEMLQLGQRYVIVSDGNFFNRFIKSYEVRKEQQPLIKKHRKF